MKTKVLLFALLILAATAEIQAQRVRVQLNFPATVRINAPGPAPYRGAIWIGPEWRWHRGQYVSVPGYWAKPAHARAVWVPGHWSHGRKGYRWVPGRWR